MLKDTYTGSQLVAQPQVLLARDSLYASLVRWVQVHPDQPYLIEAETGRSLTYAQTLAAIDTLHTMLGPLPRCLILAYPTGIANALLWLSALSGGHQLIPLDPDASDAEKARVARRFHPDMLFVAQEQDVHGFSLPQAHVFTLGACETLLAQTVSLLSYPAQPGYVCLATSGTTGEPKSVVLAEHQIVWTADHVRLTHQLTSQDCGLTVLPFFHVNGPVVSLCASLLAGSTLVIARKFSRRNFWSWIERYQVTWASVVPTIVTILLDTQRPDFLPGTLRFVRTGSAALPPADLLTFEQCFGIPLIETYGLSEAASMVVANPIPPAVHKPGSAGLPVGVNLRICAPLSAAQSVLCDVPQGDIGEICVAGPGIINSYQQNVGAEAFQEGWFRTGDLGYLDADGYLFIKGRLREVIIRGGENIAPREIEDVLLTHTSVREVAAVGRPDAIYGEQPVVFVVSGDSWSPEIEHELLLYATGRLSPSKVPVAFFPVDSLPKNATGKIERRLLREQLTRRSPDLY